MNLMVSRESGSIIKVYPQIRNDENSIRFAEVRLPRLFTFTYQSQ